MTSRGTDTGAATPPSIEVQAAVNTIRSRMAVENCNFDTAYLWLQRRMKRTNRVGVRSEWTEHQPFYDAAYRILAAEYKGAK